ncbi:MAG: 16S rRNA (guanine(527)-N(7))-methyltransferase RsmG [Chloroflexi bacterium]|nr:16S rRNA (guanine(527)-N(7))-methyltransferase RsmG [Chloroflexota bacterium]
MIPAEQLEAGLAELGLTLPESARRQMATYLAVLQKWNRVYNLTAVRDAGQMVSHHLLDSLAALPYVIGGRVADVGSGGGFPGLPFAIARPDWRFTLIDSNHKKCTFLRQAVIELALANVEIVAERVEQYRPATAFDTVVSRAFSDIPAFLELAGHLVAPQGILIAMKGVYPKEELAQVPAGYTTRDVIRLQVPGLKATRHLVVLAKA